MCKCLKCGCVCVCGVVRWGGDCMAVEAGANIEALVVARGCFLAPCVCVLGVRRVCLFVKNVCEL